MIYQFDNTDSMFAASRECKKWKWCVDGQRVLAYLEPRDLVDTSGWVVARNVAADTAAWLERV